MDGASRPAALGGSAHDPTARTPHDPRACHPRPGGVTGALRRYARSFTGFERDARVFLLATLVYGVTLSLWWVDFNLYLASLHFDNAFIGLVATAGSAAGALAAFPASLLSDRVGRRLVLILATGVSAVRILGLPLVGSSAAG